MLSFEQYHSSGFFNYNILFLKKKKNIKQLTSTSSHLSNKLTYGEIISVLGSVVDVFFENNLPPIYSLVHTGKDKEIAVEVLTRLDEHRVRDIALNPRQGLTRGMLVKTEGKELTLPVGKEIMGRMFDVFGNYSTACHGDLGWKGC